MGRVIYLDYPYLGEMNGRRVLVKGTENLGLFGEKKTVYYDLIDGERSETVDTIVPLVQDRKSINNKLDLALIDFYSTWNNQNPLSSVLRANISFSPFQLRPLLKFFNSAEKRLLIADETGLGKTIEAGMILAELIAKSDKEGCYVILCPAKLKSKWKRELKEKFGIKADFARVDDFNEYQKLRGVKIISQDSSRDSEKVDVRLDSIDLLIIDEIHNYIGRTDSQKRRKRALDLSINSGAVIGMSATPVQLNKDDLRKILNLISPCKFPEREWTEVCTIQEEVNKVISNYTHNDTLDLSKLKLLGLDCVQIEELATDKGQKGNQSLIISRLQLLGKIGKMMTRTRAIDVGKHVEREVIPHPVELCPNFINDVMNSVLDFTNKRRILSLPSATTYVMREIKGDIDKNEFIEYENKINNYSVKLDSIKKLLLEMEKNKNVTKCVVFTHWKPTFQHLSEQLSLINLKVFKIDDDENAYSVIKKAREWEGFAVLIARDSMSEGVDFEFANALINVDLPYNPAKIQQRIGRLTRYTQKSAKIFVHNFFLKNTVEEEQVSILQRRLNEFKSVVGDCEEILVTEKEPKSKDEVESVQMDYEKELENLQKVNGNLLLQVIDSSMDEEIKQFWNSFSYFKQHRLEIIREFFELVGLTIDAGNGVLRLEYNDSIFNSLKEIYQFPEGDRIHKYKDGDEILVRDIDFFDFSDHFESIIPKLSMLVLWNRGFFDSNNDRHPGNGKLKFSSTKSGLWCTHQNTKYLTTYEFESYLGNEQKIIANVHINRETKEISGGIVNE